jgi:stage II sporulation protein D
MALPSIHFTFKEEGDNFVFTGGGWGHSVGMSQFGAYAMAKSHGFNYRQIIRYYYTGSNISTGV